jgi:CxxC motif-containing protein (DUF1111 family)
MKQPRSRERRRAGGKTGAAPRSRMTMAGLAGFVWMTTDSLTAAPTTVGGRESFSAPFPGLSRQHRREFHVGNSFFKDNWVSAPATAANRDGLGPLFQARSCSSCHVNDGRGAPPSGDEVMTGLLLRLTAGDGGPDKIYGNQLAVRAVPGAEPEAAVKVTWITSEVTLADGAVVSLRRPDIQVTRWNYGEPAPGLLIGPRLAPPVFGGGLLEAVTEVDLAKTADPEDTNGDGISGRINFLTDPTTQQKVAGRFGWKANVATLRKQAAEAFAGDLGITSVEHPDENHTASQAARLAPFPDGGRPEAEALVMDRMETYLRGLGAPARRGADDAAVKAGEVLFVSLRCAACHLPELKTGDTHPFKELQNQTIHPFTDLLLHDMGPELADGRPDGQASGSEWRTAALWGIGLNAAVNGNAFFLHDGRARSPLEAILWHGGEALTSREAFKALPKSDREALLAFLNSL